MQSAVRFIIERRPYLSPIPIAISFLLGLIFRPFLFLTTSMVAFVALCCDTKEVVKMVVGSLVIVAFFSFLFAFGLSFFVLALGLWLPVALAAIIHKNYRNFFYSLSLVTAIIFLYLSVFRLSVDNVDMFWLGLVKNFFDKLRVNNLNLSDAELEVISGQIHLWSIVLMQLFFTGSLILSRWYQSKLYNPGGFSKEYFLLKIPRSFAFLLLIYLLLNVSNILPNEQFGIFGDISVLIMGLYFFQGISVIHSTGREKQVATGWFSALYFLLFLLPQFVGLFIIVAGILDSFISLRNDAGI